MSENLIVEVDGAYHVELEQMDYDTMRTGWLEGKGFRRHSLGRRILRTDTATVAAVAQLMLKYGI